MPGILISVDKFDAWSPANTEIIDIADALLAKEWHSRYAPPQLAKCCNPNSIDWRAIRIF